MNAGPEGRPFRAVVIGAGMAGVAAAIKLKEAGIDFAVYEKAETVGGTWRENVYPGIACDVPSVVYTYSFDHNPEWSRRYAPGDEIHAYFTGAADRWGVTPRIRFGEEVVRCEWIDGQWELETSKGRRDSADAVIAATGVLHHPRYPDIAGLDSFAGSCFHSARWDHSVSLDGRRVGVIGTGSTAVQITCALVDRVGHYDLFQRTAQWVMREENPVIPEEKKAQFRREPEHMAHLQRELARKFREYLVPGFLDVESARMAEIQERCVRDLEENVKDPVLREKLRPDYLAGCKRLVVSPDFHEKVQRPNLDLVTSKIERIEPRGVHTADGELHELDVLVLATGFQADRFIRPVTVLGRDGLNLNDAWVNGPLAYLSITVPGFPNLFLINGPNGPIGNLSLIEVAEAQIGYIMQLINALRDGLSKEIVVTEKAALDFERERAAAAKHTVWASGCQSWYLNASGVPATWTFSYDRFIEEMSEPKMAAFE